MDGETRGETKAQRTEGLKVSDGERSLSQAFRGVCTSSHDVRHGEILVGSSHR